MLFIFGGRGWGFLWRQNELVIGCNKQINAIHHVAQWWRGRYLKILSSMPNSNTFKDDRVIDPLLPFLTNEIQKIIFILIISNRILFKWKIVRGMTRGSCLQKSASWLITVWRKLDTVDRLESYGSLRKDFIKRRLCVKYNNRHGNNQRPWKSQFPRLFVHEHGTWCQCIVWIIMLGGKIHSVDTYRVYFLYLSSVKFISLLGKICDDTGKTGYVPMKEENLF